MGRLRDEIGRYDAIGEPVTGCSDCLDCGAVVRNHVTHDAWHVGLERQAQETAEAVRAALKAVGYLKAVG